MKSNLIRHSRKVAAQLFALAALTKRFSGFLVALPLAFSLMVPQASAAIVSYYLDQSNVLDDNVNYAKVTIADGADAANSGDVDFTVEVIESEFNIPLVDDNFGLSKFGFNFDNDIAKANLANIIPTDWSIKEDKNVDGFGVFDFELKSGSRTSLLTFSVVGVADDTVNNYVVISDIPNGSTALDTEQHYFSAHIAGYVDELSGSTTTSAKFAGSTVVPIPAGAWLFASALGALVVARRRVS